MLDKLVPKPENAAHKSCKTGKLPAYAKPLKERTRQDETRQGKDSSSSSSSSSSTSSTFSRPRRQRPTALAVAGNRIAARSPAANSSVVETGVAQQRRRTRRRRSVTPLSQLRKNLFSTRHSLDSHSLHSIGRVMPGPSCICILASSDK